MTDHGSSLRISYGMVTTEALGNYKRSSHQRKGEANFEFYKNAQKGYPPMKVKATFTTLQQLQNQGSGRIGPFSQLIYEQTLTYIKL